MYIIKNNLILIVVLILLLIILAPTLTIIYYTFNVNNYDAIIPSNTLTYINNTLLVLLLVSLFTLIITLPTTFLLVRYNFFLSNFFSYIFILPLAIPTYIMGYSYAMFFEYQGIFYKIMSVFNIKPNIDILNIYVASLMISLSLFPYLYILLKFSFNSIIQSTLEESQSVNIKDTRFFIQIVLPLSKFTIISGMFLILMETLNDYGTTYYFGVDTLSLAIFKLWSAFGNFDNAIFLSVIMLVFVFILVFLEAKFNNKNLYSFNMSRKKINIKNNSITTFHKTIFFIWCLIIFVLALVLPIGTLVYNSLNHLYLINISLLYNLWNSLLLSTVASFITVFLALILIYSVKISVIKSFKYTNILASLGYAIPGVIVAIGVIIFFKSIFLSLSVSYILTNGVIAVVFAYVVRFIAIAYNSIDSNYAKNKDVHEVSISLKRNKIYNFIKIDLPLLKSSLITSFLLVFIDSIKELPATLMLRPFNFDTLAIKSFYLANNDNIEQTSIPSLLLIMASAIVIIILTAKK